MRGDRLRLQSLVTDLCAAIFARAVSPIFDARQRPFNHRELDEIALRCDYPQVRKHRGNRFISEIAMTIADGLGILLEWALTLCAHLLEKHALAA